MKLIILALIVALSQCAPDEHLVPSLKGYYDYSKQFKMYSGYLTLQAEPLIKTHYLFITSKNNPETDDLVLWSNGGPGCSSLIGFLSELGPHLTHAGSGFLAPKPNPYSWNTKANLLFLQSPPGVGFSLNNDPKYKFNDTRTAQDNLASIKEWFKLFPEFNKHKFWISGESYCGMYLPLLADQLIKNKETIIEGGSLNFKGMLIGNGVMLTTSRWRRQSRNAYYSRHYYYGPEINSLLESCQYTQADDRNPSCLMGNKLADQAVARQNPYNSIGICYNTVPGSSTRRFWYSAFDQQMYNSESNQPSCSSDHFGMENFFNNPTVQQQLHVVPQKWTACSDKVGSTYQRDESTLGLFPSFKKAGLKVLLFTGNVDAQVSYVQTEEYIKRIGWDLVKPKISILNDLKSLQGWVTGYDGLTFYVVNGAGHMVPQDKPAAAWRMFDSFLSGAI